MVWERKSSLDWSRDLGIDRVRLAQSMVGLTSLSQGSPRMTFSLPRERTWNVICRVIPSRFRNRVEVKRMTPFLLMELSAFRACTGVGSRSVGGDVCGQNSSQCRRY
jgi:hypothetical protein